MTPALHAISAPTCALVSLLHAISITHVKVVVVVAKGEEGKGIGVKILIYIAT